MNDWQLLYRYKHSLVQKYRVRFIGAVFNSKERSLDSLCGRYRIQIDANNSIKLLNWEKC